MKTALVACEESGIWSEALWRHGYDVTQCDLLLPAGEFSECIGWKKFGGDVREFRGQRFNVVAAFPPCTDLARCGAHLWKKKDVYPALAFATEMAALAANAEDSGLVENPGGLLERALGAPSVAVHPWMYADDESENLKKRTLLWLYRWRIPFPKWAASVSARSFIDDVPPGKNQKRIRSKSWRGMASAFVAMLPRGDVERIAA